MNKAEVINIEKKDIVPLITGGVSISEIKSMVEKFKDLTVIPDDKESYEAVCKARMQFVHLRTDIDKNRKRLNENAQKEIKERNKTADNIVSIFEPAETHLTQEKEKEDNRIQAIKDAEIAKEKARVEAIQAQIQKIKDLKNIPSNLNSVKIKEKIEEFFVETKFDFQEFNDQAKMISTETITSLEDSIKARIKFEEEQAEAKAEAERLEKIRQEQESERQKLEAEKKAAEEVTRKEREALEAEKRKIQEEKRKIRTQQFNKTGYHEFFNTVPFEDIMNFTDDEWQLVLSEAHKDAEVARKEREAREAREAQEKADREAKEKAEADENERLRKEKEEAMRPEKERLSAWLDNIWLDLPELNLEDESLRVLHEKFIDNLRYAIQDIKVEIERL